MAGLCGGERRDLDSRVGVVGRLITLAVLGLRLSLTSTSPLVLTERRCEERDRLDPRELGGLGTLMIIGGAAEGVGGSSLRVTGLLLVTGLLSLEEVPDSLGSGLSRGRVKSGAVLV